MHRSASTQGKRTAGRGIPSRITCKPHHEARKTLLLYYSTHTRKRKKRHTKAKTKEKERKASTERSKHASKLQKQQKVPGYSLYTIDQKHPSPSSQPKQTKWVKTPVSRARPVQNAAEGIGKPPTTMVDKLERESDDTNKKSN